VTFLPVTTVVRSELQQSVWRATGLLRRLGLREHARFATAVGNSADGFALSWAATRAGVREVALHPTASVAEAQAPLEATRPSVLLVDRTTGAGVRAAADALGVTTLPLALAGELAQEPACATPRTRPIGFTSGTTGVRKAVDVGVHDPAWGRSWLDDERAAFHDRHGDHALVLSPLHHSGPFRHALVVADAGGSVSVMAQPDTDTLLQALRQLRPTSLFCVPTHLYRLLRHPDLRADDLASLTLLVHAGAACPIDLKQQLLALAPNDSVWEFYGSTEGQFSVCSPADWQSAPGSVGVARAGSALQVRSDDGKLCDAGQTGTVFVRAPSHARWSYLDQPAATAAAWDGDWFTVGDLATMDAGGRLTLRGRPCDLVITGGVNVYPAEVEQLLQTLPGVGEVAVFGVPDREWGQRLMAVVTAADPNNPPAAAQLRVLATELLSPARTPREFVLVPALPRTATGKIRRHDLDSLVTR
jgi:long-chain acyl-CoA synthetase